MQLQLVSKDHIFKSTQIANTSHYTVISMPTSLEDNVFEQSGIVVNENQWTLITSV